MTDQMLIRVLVLAMAGLATVSLSSRGNQGQVTVTARDPTLATQSQDPGLTGTASVSGKVVNAATAAPIPGAVVRVTRLSPSGVSTLQSVTCDSQGRFVFVQLPENARIVIEADHPGYSRGAYGLQEGLSASRIPELSLRANEWRRDLEIRMWRFANISGRVLDDRLEPLVGVAVRAFVVAPLGGRPQLASAGLTSTDDLGFYRLRDLGPGEYLVGIVSSQATVLDSTPETEPRRPVGALFTGGPPDRGPASVSAPTFSLQPGHRMVANSLSVAPAVDGSRTAYAPVFFPDARDPRSGQMIVLPPGTSRDGVDFTLRPVRSFRVSGRASSSVPVQNAPLLRLVPSGAEDLGIGNEIATTLLAPDGSFTFLGVPAGDYTLLANAGGLELMRAGAVPSRLPDPPGISDGSIGSGLVGGTNLRFSFRSAAASSVWVRQSVTVADRDVNDLSLELRPTLHIRGRIELAAGTAVPAGLSDFSVSAEPLNRDPSLGANSVDVELSTRPMAFGIDGLLPGNYLVGSPTMQVLSVTWRGRDVTDVGLELTENIEDLVVTLTSQTTMLTGTVTGLSDSRVRAVALAFPTDSRLWSSYGWTPRRLRTALINADGTFAIRNLPAGDYLLIAVEERFASSWTDPAFLRAAVIQATRVSLAWGAKADVSLAFRQNPPK